MSNSWGPGKNYLFLQCQNWITEFPTNTVMLFQTLRASFSLKSTATQQLSCHPNHHWNVHDVTYIMASLMQELIRYSYSMYCTSTTCERGERSFKIPVFLFKNDYRRILYTQTRTVALCRLNMHQGCWGYMCLFIDVFAGARHAQVWMRWQVGLWLLVF